MVVILLQFTPDSSSPLPFYCLKNHLEMKSNSAQLFLFFFFIPIFPPSPPPVSHQVIEAAKNPSDHRRGHVFPPFFFPLNSHFFSLCHMLGHPLQKPHDEEATCDQQIFTACPPPKNKTKPKMKAENEIPEFCLLCV